MDGGAERPLPGAPAGQLQVGDVLAEKYRVERILGRGGMGVVVAARHEQLGERVAIKFLLPESLINEEVVARFLQEGRAAVRIRSEHVARVLDVGTLHNGAPYLVMEYLDGQDLQQVVRKRKQVPIEEAVDLVLQACEAIAEAHSIGILHRDLKPANLFLTQRADGSPCVKVIDFGISKIQNRSADAIADENGGMTTTHVLLGSPLYMAPEQMRSLKYVDERSDIYSLAGILHALLTGRPPFGGDTLMEIYDNILKGLRPLASARADAPPALEAVLRRGLSKSPDDRFGDVGELASALSPFASARGKLSIEAICGVIEQAGTRRLPRLTPPDVAIKEASTSEAEASTSEASASASAERGKTPRPDPGGTAGTWERERARTEGPVRRAVAIALVALAVGAGLVIGRFVLSPAPPARLSADPAAPTVEPTGAAGLGATAGGTAAAVISRAPAAEVASSPTASASAAQVASPPSSASAGKPTGPPSRPRAPARPRDQKDLFAEPL